MVDWGIHYVHNIRKVLGLTLPDTVSTIGVYYFCEKETVFVGDLGWQVFSKGSEKVANGDVRFQPWIPEQGIKYQKMITDMFVEFSNGIHTNSNEGISNTFEEAQKTTACVTYGDMAYRA